MEKDILRPTCIASILSIKHILSLPDNVWKIYKIAVMVSLCGIVLCSDTDEDIARYSVLHGNEQLFASEYKLYLPTEEELRAEIEAQKAIFYLQQKKPAPIPEQSLAEPAFFNY